MPCFSTSISSIWRIVCFIRFVLLVFCFFFFAVQSHIISSRAELFVCWDLLLLLEGSVDFTGGRQPSNLTVGGFKFWYSMIVLIKHQTSNMHHITCYHFSNSAFWNYFCYIFCYITKFVNRVLTWIHRITIFGSMIWFIYVRWSW